ncbi:MAG: endonuclease/exonuclease/phosphatase family protein [Cytophagales bacterium]|nr:endonuclease/exonuclease/phosphatase family protein [Cytophagales bacterium]MDW8384670.1 endonuclease/exonuclease/phosphatase family protein [Flammeovirgaceae bacterium]
MTLRIIKKIVKFGHLIAVLIAFLAYGSLFIPPDKFFLASVGAFTTPFWWIYHVISGIIWFFRRKKILPLLSFLFVLIAMPIWSVTFSWNTALKDTCDFKVFSYNVRVFNSYPEHHKGNLGIPKTMISHVSEVDADILCFQEDYNDPRDKRRIFHTEQVFKKKGWNYVARDVKKFNPPAHQFGLTIYSKFPILRCESIPIDAKHTNGAMYADIQLNDSCIVRVINMHLQSTYLQEKELQDPKVETKNIFSRMHRAIQRRSLQVRQLIEFARLSPYPVIICGDLNETPYSYAYFELRSYFKNAFETRGKGFGFTYNGKLLSFLRIDHQFYSSTLQILDFQTLYQYKYSDHFPTIASYCCNKH